MRASRACRTCRARRKRRSATVSSVETNYRWDAGYTVLNEEGDSGDLERTFVGRNTAQIEGDDAATGDYFYHTHDHLGSTRHVYDQSKNEVVSFSYTPYGRELFATNRALTTRGYTGHTREAALGGGYYAPFRYYLPNLARWEKRDPLGMVDGPNVYAYVRGEPVGRIDLIGLSHSCELPLLNCVLEAMHKFGGCLDTVYKGYAAQKELMLSAYDDVIYGFEVGKGWGYTLCNHIFSDGWPVSERLCKAGASTFAFAGEGVVTTNLVALNATLVAALNTAVGGCATALTARLEVCNRRNP